MSIAGANSKLLSGKTGIRDNRTRFPGRYGLGKAEELFGEEISEEDKETESTDMTKWQIFVEYVLKNKVIWLLCFSGLAVITCCTAPESAFSAYAESASGVVPAG